VLSEREHEVALLVAQGLTNRQIGEQLVITRKTVETHVGHVLGKLGLVSRVQIATWGLRQGLAPPILERSPREPARAVARA
jgi:DNA-binding CsgD family transcriptional regulator